MRPFRKLTEDVWQNIIAEVYETNNMHVVAEKYGVTPQAILYQLKKRNLPSVKGGHRKRKLNEKRFTVLDEQSAYWLGFIMADGCLLRTTKLYKRPNRLVIQLSSIDRDHLEKFKEFLETDAEITTFTPKGTFSTNDICRISVNSTELCKTLMDYGISERKTGNEIVPILPDRLIRHFIRGYFDGDGCITIGSRGYPSFSICGNRHLLSYIQVYLVSDCNLNFTKIVKDKRHENIYSLHYTGNQTATIYDYLYKDSTIYLKRKRDKFNLLLSQ